jgi:hypothetical protein
MSRRKSSQDQKVELLETLVANQVQMITLLCSLNTSMEALLGDLRELKQTDRHHPCRVASGGGGSSPNYGLSSNYASNLSTTSSMMSHAASPTRPLDHADVNDDRDENPAEFRNPNCDESNDEPIDYKRRAVPQAVDAPHADSLSLTHTQPGHSQILDHVQSKLREQKVNIEVSVITFRVFLFCRPKKNLANLDRLFQRAQK